MRSGDYHDSGFSLIEMLVVLVLIGAVFGIAFPRINSGRESRPAQFAQRIFTLVQSARLSAIKSNTNRNIIISVQHRQIASEGSGDSLAVPKDLSFNATFGQRQEELKGDARITFFPSGGSTGGSLIFQGLNEETASVEVNWLTGAVTLGFRHEQ
jgi:general secretion pathway protein H